jgi:hypothetical protein
MPLLVAMEYHRSNCLAGGVNCDFPKRADAAVDEAHLRRVLRAVRSA